MLFNQGTLVDSPTSGARQGGFSVDRHCSERCSDEDPDMADMWQNVAKPSRANVHGAARPMANICQYPLSNELT